MIEVKNVTKSYGDLQVLKGISLSIPEKEVIAITGASGAGKSTLLHLLGTLDRPDSGEILYGNEDVTRYPAGRLSRFRNRNIGFVFQFHHLLPEFTALENVCMPAWIGGASRKEAATRAAGLLELLGLRDRMHHRPSELSGGEQQRVSVARALINSPQVVLADEPSGNLDSHTRNELHRLFFTLRDELGQTFVVVTHDTDLAGMSDRRIVISDGLIV